VLKTIELEGTGQPPLAIKKVTAVNLGKMPRFGQHDPSRLGRIFLEEMEGGVWRLTYTSHTIPDITKLTAFRLVREPEPGPTLIEMVERIGISRALGVLGQLENLIRNIDTLKPLVRMGDPSALESMAERLGLLTEMMIDLGEAVGFETKKEMEKEHGHQETGEDS
jgi:hypothetical protein